MCQSGHSAGHESRGWNMAIDSRRVSCSCPDCVQQGSVHAVPSDHTDLLMNASTQFFQPGLIYRAEVGYLAQVLQIQI